MHIFILNLSGVVYQNSHPHTFQNTYITNTHTHINADARFLQLRSDLLSLLSHCMSNMI